MNDKIIGLDIGVKSIGWCILNKEKKEIIDLGVNLFDAPEEPKTKKTLMLKRRNNRLSRRQNSRKKYRRERLGDFFINNNFLTREEIKNYFNSLRERGNGINLDTNYTMHPIYLRKFGLSNELTPLQFYIVSQKLFSNRGYFDKSVSTDTDRKDVVSTKKLLKDNNLVYPIDFIFFFNNKLTLENFTTTDLRSKNLKYNTKIIKKTKDKKTGEFLEKEQEITNLILFERNDLVKEYKQILSNITYLTNKQKENLIKELTFQKDFEDGPKNKEIDKSHKFQYSSFEEKIGKCTYYKKEDRDYKNTIFGDIFFILNELNKLKDIDGKGIENVLKNYFNTLEFSKNKTKELLGEKVSFKNVEKGFNGSEKEDKGITFAKSNLFLLNLSEDSITSEKIDKNGKVTFQTTKEENKKDKEEIINSLKDLIFDETLFNQIENNKFNKIGETFSRNKSYERLQNKLEEFGKEKDFLKRKLHLSKSSPMGVSNKFVIDALLNQINNNEKLGKFAYKLKEINEEKYLKEMEGKIIKDIFPKIQDEDMARNKVVFGTINEVRRLLNKLFKKYGAMDIILEVASDLYAEKSHRLSIERSNKDNGEYNKKIEEELFKLGIKINKTNKDKLKLFKIQKQMDFLDPKIEKMKLEDIFTYDYEIDHIVPYSLYNDDSFTNKILTSRTRNQEKKQRTPKEYFKDILNISQEEITNWETNIKKIFEKDKSDKGKMKVKNLIRDNYTYSDFKDEIFKSVDLNNTRYINSYIYDYLRVELKRNYVENVPNIYSVPGSFTSSMRKFWMRDTVWGEIKKARNLSTFHHTIDAYTIANLLNTKNIFKYSQYLRLIEYYRYLLFNKKYKNENILTYQGFGSLSGIFNDIIRIIEHQGNVKGFNLDKKEEFKKDIINFYNEFTVLIKEKDFNFDNFNTIYKNKVILNYFKPLIKNVEEDIRDFLPVKLSSFKEEESKKYEKKIISKKEWENIHQGKIYPVPNYKEKGRIGNFLGSENPNAKYTGLKKLDKDNIVKTDDGFINKKTKKPIKNIIESNGNFYKKTNDGYLERKTGKEKEGFFKDGRGNVWDIRSYAGWKINKDKNILEKVYNYDLIKEKREEKNSMIFIKNRVFSSSDLSKIMKKYNLNKISIKNDFIKNKVDSNDLNHSDVLKNQYLRYTGINSDYPQFELIF